MSKNMNQGNYLIVLVMLYQCSLAILQQVTTLTNPECITLNLIFIASAVIVGRQHTFKLTVNGLIGKSKFSCKKRSDWIFMTGYLVLTSGLAYFIRANSIEPPLYSLNQLAALCLLSPFVEELFARCIFMNIFRDKLPDVLLLVASIIFWVSIHNLHTCDVCALVGFAAICGECYLRFSSFRCCYFLHAVWNFTSIFRC